MFNISERGRTNKVIARSVSKISAWIWAILHSFPELEILVEKILTLSEYKSLLQGKKLKFQMISF